MATASTTPPENYVAGIDGGKHRDEAVTFARPANRPNRFPPADPMAALDPCGSNAHNGYNPEMPDHLCERKVYESPIVEVADVCCRPKDRGCGVQETSRNPSIAFVRSGAFVKHMGGDELLADANHVLFFNADQPYRVSHPIDGGDDCTSLRFDRDVLLEAASAYDPAAAENAGQPFPVPHVLSSSQALAAVYRLRGTDREGHDRVFADELCLMLLDGILADAFGVIGRRPRRVRPDTARAHRRLADAARMVIAEEYRRPLSLADLGERVGSSSFHLVRLFRREVGLPIHRYLSRLRLRDALERLAGGCDDLTGLALDLGFSSHSHLTDAFHREFGVSPSAFRRVATTSFAAKLSKNLKV